MSSTEFQLVELVAMEAALRAQRHELVAKLRMDGWTWTRIGDALGISKQAAAKTYGADADRVLRRTMREAREVAGQITVTEVIAEVQLEDSHQLGTCSCGHGLLSHAPSKLSTRENVGGLGACKLCSCDLDQLEETTETDAEPELVGWGECHAPGGCENRAYGREVLCEHHLSVLDAMTDELEVPRTGPGAVHCPECRVEPGESCRVLPSYWPTRGKRFHAKRLTLAKKN